MVLDIGSEYSFMEPDSSVDWAKHTPEQDNVHWRFESFCNNYTEEVSVNVYCQPYLKVSDTPKGFWVSPAYGGNHQPLFIYEQIRKKLILNDARRKWAWPTKKEAFDSYIHRTKKRIQFARHNLNVALAVQRLLEEEQKK